MLSLLLCNERYCNHRNSATATFPIITDFVITNSLVTITLMTLSLHISNEALQVLYKNVSGACVYVIAGVINSAPWELKTFHCNDLLQTDIKLNLTICSNQKEQYT